MESTAGAPGKRQQAAPAASGSVAPYLAEEVVRNILVYLPSKSVHRCRAVCKDWLRIVSDREFAVDHHRLQPTLPLVSFLRGGGAAGTKAETGTGPVDCCVDAFDLGAAAGSFRPVVRFTDTEERCGGGGFHIHGSCDGLLLLSFENRFYVCNPATHQWNRLPAPLRDSWFGGFYRHDPSGEYRVLFYRGRWPFDVDYYIMVPDSRRGTGIGLPAERDGYKLNGQPYGPPVLLRGHLHWMRRQRDGVLAFNTTTEALTAVTPPVIREHMSLAEVGDELAVLSCGGAGNNGTVVEVWVLKDLENETWVSMHRIGLPPAVNVGSTFTFDESWRMFFLSGEGIVVVTPEQTLVHYAMNGTLLETFPACDNGRHLKIAPYTFKESLVRHAFFEKQDCDADDDSEEDEPEPPPPFFQGL